MVGNTYKDLSLILAEKQRVIENLKDEKNSLLKVISHDIKSPFNQLFALIQLFDMDGDNLDDKQREYIEKMYFAVMSGIEMIQNLQDFRSIDEDTLQLNQGSYDLRVLLKKIVSRFGIQSRLMNVGIRLQEKKSAVFIRTDEILFLKVYEKILSNALKYSYPGTVVNISIEKEDGEVWVHTRDQGPGLSAHEVEFIFEPFRTLSTKPVKGGGTTGLGMYIVHKITEMLGIKVEIGAPSEGGFCVSLGIRK